MKKNLMLSFMAVALSCSAFAGNFHVLKQNGGTNGYKTVNQTTSGGNVDLSCSDPGNLKCEAKSTTPDPVTPKSSDVNDILPGIEEQINSGNLSGSTTIDRILVEWNGRDVNNCEIIFSIIN